MSDDTVTRDHVWFDGDGEAWCGPGKSADLLTAQITWWSFAPYHRPREA